MLRLEHISVAYGKHQALQDVTLDIAPSRTTAILGANGAGKSTLLKTIAGLVRPQPGGRILFHDRPIEQEAPHRIVAAGIALVPEGRRLFGEMSVMDNLRIGAYPERARAGESERLERQLTLFPRLAERRQQLAKTMSGGEQQMLAIARALMSEPKVLLLDEPSLGLSPRLVSDLFSVLRRLTEGGQSIVLVEQNAHRSLKLANHIYVLENGRIASAGTPAEMRQDKMIQKPISGSDVAAESRTSWLVELLDASRLFRRSTERPALFMEPAQEKATWRSPSREAAPAPLAFSVSSIAQAESGAPEQRAACAPDVQQF